MIASDDEQRLWSALSLAAAQAARGHPVSLFFSGHAAACAVQNYGAALDAGHKQKGAPTIADLFASCADLGVHLCVCQTGLHLVDMSADRLRPGCEATGLIAWLAGTKDAQLMFV